MRDTRDLLIEQLLEHEGYRRFPYTDTTGHLTVGIGRNLTDVGVSPEEAMILLERDIDIATFDLNATYPWFAALDDTRKRVVIDMRFNLGGVKFRGFTVLVAALAAGDYPAAAAAMRDSVWAGQVKSRAARLIAMMDTGTGR